jgi:CRP-like cAMP-binding protein
MFRKQDKDTVALAEELGSSSVFGHLPAEPLHALASSARLLRVPDQWAVLIESQPADSAYFLLDGTAEVRRQGATLASLGAGQLVGEAALVEHRTRNASVITTSPVRVLRWSYDDLESVFGRHSDVADVFAEQHRRRAS